MQKKSTVLSVLWDFFKRKSFCQRVRPSLPFFGSEKGFCNFRGSSFGFFGTMRLCLTVKNWIFCFLFEFFWCLHLARDVEPSFRIVFFYKTSGRKSCPLLSGRLVKWPKLDECKGAKDRLLAFVGTVGVLQKKVSWSSFHFGLLSECILWKTRPHYWRLIFFSIFLYHRFHTEWSTSTDFNSKT